MHLHTIGLNLSQWTEFDFSKPSHLFHFALYQLNSLVYLANINLVYHSLVLTAVLGLLIGVISAIKLHQIEVYVVRSVSSISAAASTLNSSPLHLLNCISTFFSAFSAHNAVSLRWLADVNRIYGSAIFGFMLINVPLNAILVMMLLLGRLKLSLVPVVVSLAATQLLIIFVINLCCAVLSRQLHRPAKLILHLSIISQQLEMKWLKWQQFRVRLRMALYLERFHTSNQFTVNFGRNGKITFQSFGRVIFFYFKFLIFAFKLVGTTVVGS